MKKVILVSAVLAALSFSALATVENDLGHERWRGVASNFTGSINSQEQFDRFIGHAGSVDTQLKLTKAFNDDGKLTAQEIKDSGLSDHHLYTAYLASATSQADYDKKLKQMTGDYGMVAFDDKFVSNRDMKAHGSMLLGEVDDKVKTVVDNQGKVNVENTAINLGQDERLDKTDSKLNNLVNGLQQMGTVTPPPVTGGEYDDTAVKGDIASNKADINTNKENITTNSNSITAMGDAFEQRVDTVNGYLGQIGDAIKSNSNTALNGRVDNLENAFAAQAAHTTQEIARLDGRIDDLEKKTDKLKAGVAGANAIGSLSQYTGNGTHHVAVGVGGYDGANAIAGGYTYAISKNTTIRATVAYDSEGDFGFGASVGHSW
ncbi:MAG: YadA C-terminal domain-containing protein [Cetobacterium sp.]